MPAPDDRVFAALGDPTRRALLERLSRDGPMTATELAPAWPVSRQALVKHLGYLASAGLVDAERHGREVRYEVADGGLDAAVLWIEEVGRRWDRRLEGLERHLSEPSTVPRHATRDQRGSAAQLFVTFHR